MSLKILRLVALDIDGPCLKDTFSPVIRMLVDRWGGEYTAEIENGVFSQNRKKAARFLIEQFGLEMDSEELLDLYFDERSRYEASTETGPVEGLEKFLFLVRGMGLGLVCYGGLDEEYFRRNLGPLVSYFDSYICTNEFRPGVREIVRDSGLDFREVLFIDDVSGVALAARDLGSPFIGIPATFSWGHQKSEMVKAGVRYLFESVSGIDEQIIRRVDGESFEGSHWNGA